MTSLVRRSSGPQSGVTRSRTVHTSRTSGGDVGDYDHWGGLSHGGVSSSSRSRSMKQSSSGGMSFGGGGGSGHMQSSSRYLLVL